MLQNKALLTHNIIPTRRYPEHITCGIAVTNLLEQSKVACPGVKTLMKTLAGDAEFVAWPCTIPNARRH